jgi:hypothetical protein
MTTLNTKINHDIIITIVLVLQILSQTEESQLHRSNN